jgi:hypothetical protein
VGSARRTVSEPTVLEAPPIFWMMIGWPSFSDSRSAVMRPSPSVPPPGG